MVTHRWWGNKFCKRACKNTHRRENHHTQSGWVIPRFFTFAGGACLAAAAAVAMLTLLLASANAAPSEERPVAGSSLEFNKEDGTLYIDWSGPIVAGMADDLRAALGKYGTTLNRVVLFLDSVGGKVDDSDRVIEVLNEIKLRHQLITVVPHGKLCASMCIPIFLQGEDRLAARASIWLFHEAAQRQANGQQEADLWQTGGDLISAKSGIIMHSLGDRTERAVAPPPVDADRGRDLPLGKKTAADAVGNAPIRSE